MEILVDRFKMSPGSLVLCSYKFVGTRVCAYASVCCTSKCVCVCVSFGQGRSVWLMLCTAVVQMKEATCSLPFLHFLLTSIIYTFSQTYKQPPIRPTLTRSMPGLYTHDVPHIWYVLMLVPFVFAWGRLKGEIKERSEETLDSVHWKFHLCFFVSIYLSLITGLQKWRWIHWCSAPCVNFLLTHFFAFYQIKLVSDPVPVRKAWLLVVGVFVSHSVTVVVGRTTLGVLCFLLVREFEGMQCVGLHAYLCVCVWVLQWRTISTSHIKSEDKYLASLCLISPNQSTCSLCADWWRGCNLNSWRLC